MNEDKFNKILDSYMQRLKLLDDSITQKDQFKWNEGSVSYKLDIGSMCNRKSLRVHIPRFVDKVFVGDNQDYMGLKAQRYMSNIKLKRSAILDIYTYSNTHDFNQAFLAVDSLNILGEDAIFSGQYASVLVIDSIRLSDTVPYIGSYAFCVSKQCSIDIQKLKDCKIDPRFLYVKPHSGEGIKPKIICNKHQYNYFLHNRSFKYSDNLVLSNDK